MPPDRSSRTTSIRKRSMISSTSSASGSRSSDFCTKLLLVTAIFVPLPSRSLGKKAIWSKGDGYRHREVLQCPEGLRLHFKRGRCRRVRALLEHRRQWLPLARRGPDGGVRSGPGSQGRRGPQSHGGLTNPSRRPCVERAGMNDDRQVHPMVASLDVRAPHLPASSATTGANDSTSSPPTIT